MHLLNSKQLIAAATVAAFCVAPVQAQEHKYTIATMAVPGETVPVAAERFAAKVKERAGEDFEITYNDSLLAGPELAPGVRDGRVEMAVTTYPYLTSAEPRFGVTNLPGLVTGPEDYRKLLDGYLRKEWRPIWEKDGNGIPLVEGLWTPVTLMTTTPIRTAEDFKGKRIRVSNVETGEFVTRLGASPVPLPAGEIMTGLERGVIDGFITSVCYSYEQGFFRVAKYINDWGISPSTGWTIVMNKDIWDGLPAETQAIMSDIGMEVENEMWDLFYTMKKDCYANAEKAGVEIITASPEERAKAYAPANIDPVYDSYNKRSAEKNIDGAAFVGKAREILAK